MKLELKTYMAGVATAGFAIAAGFGGGIFLANSVESNSAVPAPGLSRIERTKREAPKAVVVETTAQASADAPSINPLAEAQPLRVVEVQRANASDTAMPVDQAIQPAVSLPMQADRPPHEAALPAAVQAISLSPRQRNVRRANVAERPRAPDEPQVRERHFGRKDKANGRKLEPQEPKSRLREVARYREGNIRYVVRTRDGAPANVAEVDQLKRELRERREGRVAEMPALSYGSERRAAFPHIFSD